MIARLLIYSSIDKLKDEVFKTLALHLEGVNVNHPDLLYLRAGEKLGIAEAKKIKEFFSLKPYSAKGRVVVIEDATVLTHEAQNALLKTLEELPSEAILILGAKSDANLLPTILSRCQIVRLDAADLAGPRQPTYEVYTKDLEELLNSTVEERFQYVAELKDRGEFLHALVYYFHAALPRNVADKEIKEFLEEILQAEKWARQNVNTRAILEYLMLKMPGI